MDSAAAAVGGMRPGPSGFSHVARVSFTAGA
jgi:hypothetical protein